MLLCLNCNICSSGRLKTDVGMSAEEIIKETLSLFCNCKLETMVSVAFLAASFSGGEKKLHQNYRYLYLALKKYFL